MRHWVSTASVSKTSLAVMCSSFSAPSICHFFSHLTSLLPFFPSAQGPQREWDVGCMVIESVLIGLQRGLREANESQGIRAAPLTASLIPHSAGKHKRSTTRGIRKRRNITFFQITQAHRVLISAISSDLRPRKSFLQHWLFHLTDWVHHLSVADCHISLRCHHWRLSCHVGVPGQRGTDVEMSAEEEGVIALSARRRCAHAEPSCPSPPIYLRWTRGFKKEIVLTGEEERQGSLSCDIVISSLCIMHLKLDTFITFPCDNQGLSSFGDCCLFPAFNHW